MSNFNVKTEIDFGEGLRWTGVCTLTRLGQSSMRTLLLVFIFVTLLWLLLDVNFQESTPTWVGSWQSAEAPQTFETAPPGTDQTLVPQPHNITTQSSIAQTLRNSSWNATAPPAQQILNKSSSVQSTLKAVKGSQNATTLSPQLNSATTAQPLSQQLQNSSTNATLQQSLPPKNGSLNVTAQPFQQLLNSSESSSAQPAQNVSAPSTKKPENISQNSTSQNATTSLQLNSSQIAISHPTQNVSKNATVKQPKLQPQNGSLNATLPAPKNATTQLPQQPVNGSSQNATAQLQSTTAKPTQPTVSTLPPLSIKEMKDEIRLRNAQQIIFNDIVFGPLRNDSLVIVVQVHSRITYLGHLINSFREARGIHEVLLIFSHDVFDPQMNELIHGIDFCKVMQIFYPHSVQTHPYEFPGDCPINMTKEKALNVSCSDALHPRTDGWFRKSHLLQCKHHWWWKANRVFDHLDVTQNFNGLVVFFEEDHYVAEDFIYIIQLMEKKIAAINCSKCNMLSLGYFAKAYDYKNNAQTAYLTPLASNMGMTFNRTTWREIQNCTNLFCYHNDYNWDWSLQKISQHCMRNEIYSIMMLGPRVFHVGNCGGMHHNQPNCNPNVTVLELMKVLEAAKPYFFPENLTMGNAGSRAHLNPGNGGWEDTRDQQLCLNMTKKDFVLQTDLAT